MRDEEILLLAGAAALAWIYLSDDLGVTLGPITRVGSPAAYAGFINAASEKWGVPADTIASVIQHESGWNPSARANGSTARGLMQMTKAAAQDVGADWNSLDDPEIAIDAGTAYLAILIGEFGSYDGVRAYYAGPGTIRAEKNGGGNQTLLAAADDYVGAIFG